jgi:hypothetical protein
MIISIVSIITILTITILFFRLFLSSFNRQQHCHQHTSTTTTTMINDVSGVFGCRGGGGASDGALLG